jgi:hypothetical protein
LGEAHDHVDRRDDLATGEDGGDRALDHRNIESS